MDTSFHEYCTAKIIKNTKHNKHDKYNGKIWNNMPVKKYKENELQSCIASKYTED